MATVDELQADLVELRQARLALARGDRIKDIWRDGRRIMKSEVTLQQLTDLISIYEQDLAAAQATAEGRPRRSPIQTWIRD